MTTTAVDRRAAFNTGLAKVAVQYSADTFVINQTLVLRINICGKNPHLRQARKRYAKFLNYKPKKINKNEKNNIILNTILYHFQFC
jgi:hypothetical protein